LGSSATESDASKLQALTMASYGARVPISYRFAMPPDVQTSLLEYADPTPVCSVAYRGARKPDKLSAPLFHLNAKPACP